jgi:excisionase family DNA binding protein
MAAARAELAVVPEPAEALLTPADVATRWKVSRSFVYAEIRSGRLRAVYLGRLPRITEAALREYMVQREARRS